MPVTVTALTRELEEAAAVGDPAQRALALRRVRDQLSALTTEVDDALALAEAEREVLAEYRPDGIVLEARFQADLADELLRRGLMTEVQVEEAGLPRHRDLDVAEDRGRLVQEAAYSMARMVRSGEGNLGVFMENLHPRNRRGRFRETPEASTPESSGLKRVMGGNGGSPVSRPAGMPVFKTPPVKTTALVTQTAKGVPDGARPAGMSKRQAEAERTSARKERDRKRAVAQRVTLKTTRGARTQEAMIERAGREAFEEAFNAARKDGKTEAMATKLAGFARSAAMKDAEARDPGRNPLGRVSHAALLDYARSAMTVPSTADMHSDIKGGKRVWHKDREQLHDAIIDVLLRQRNEDRTLSATNGYYPSQVKPEVLFMSGGYGAGKSSIRSKLEARGETPNDSVVVDADQVKAMLPEFAYTAGTDPEANLRVYEEAWDVAQELQRRAQERSMNIVVDGMAAGGVEDVFARVDGFRERGYGTARIAFVDVPTDQALPRAAGRALRAKQTGDVANMRHVPEPIMRATHRDAAALIPAVMSDRRATELGIGIQVYDNSGDADPVQVASFAQGQLKVQNRKLWERVLRKGDERIESLEEPRPSIDEATRAILAEAQALGLNESPRPTGPVSSQLFAPLLGPNGLPLATKEDGSPDWTAVGTHALYGDGKGDFTEERVSTVHDPIIDRLLRSASGEPLAPAPDEATGRPVALFMAGGTASGKSTATRLPENADFTPEQAVFIDSDAIKELLPEYQEMMGANGPDGQPTTPDRFAAVSVHQESKFIARRLQAIAEKRRLNLVLDGTGNSAVGWFPSAMMHLASAGYLVDAFYVNADTDVALSRAVGRVKETGRWVPEKIHRETHRMVSAAFAERGRVDGEPEEEGGEPTQTEVPSVMDLVQDGRVVRRFKLYDTTSGPAKLIASKPDGGLFRTDDPVLLERFIAKKDEGDKPTDDTPTAEEPIA